MRIMKGHLAQAFVLLLLASAAALAQTPDGLPPALETVCDRETGSAFGWCNAYCEAMDCDLANDGDPLTEPSASGVACGRVRTRFEQATGRGMPCDDPCPCTANPGAFPLWAAYLAGELAGAACLQDGDVCPLGGFPPELCTPPLGDATYIATAEGIVVASSLGIPFNPPFCGDSVGSGLPLAPAQAVLCKAQLDAALAASGLVCGF
jgi:hypothetical protein